MESSLFIKKVDGFEALPTSDADRLESKHITPTLLIP